MEMTRASLLDICKQHGLYRTPHINDQLYANFKGFTRIACLEPYTGLKSLFLEGNALESLEGIPPLEHLKCLFAQQNRVQELPDFSHLPQLTSLNISHNEISLLQGLQNCTHIDTLTCTHNYLKSTDSVRHLQNCPTLQTVDLQSNKLDEPDVLEVFKSMPNLKCLYLKGNPVVSMIKNYRKTVIASIPSLTYLDDRPVFENERKVVEGWLAAGAEGEREARDEIAQAGRLKQRRNFEYMQAIRAEAFRQKRERLGMAAGDTDPDLEAFDDEEWQFEVDPPELVEARKRLAEFSGATDKSGAVELADGNVQDGEIPAGRTVEGDGDIYLNQVRAAQNEHGVSKGVSGLSIHEKAKSRIEPSAVLREQTFACAATLEANFLPGTDTSDKPPPLERVPAQSGLTSGLNDLD